MKKGILVWLEDMRQVLYYAAYISVFKLVV